MKSDPQSLYIEEDLLQTQKIRPNQDEEIPPDQLSQDEAMEKSFTVNSMYNKGRGKHKANIPQSSVIVAKSILGVGVLGLPYVAKQFGLLFASLLIIFAYLQTQYASRLFLKCKNLCGRSNISTIGYHVFEHRNIIIFINIIIILNNFGLCFAEMIIQSTAAQNFMGELFYQETWYKYLYSGISALIMMPMMVIKKIERLRYAGLVAVLAMTVFCVTVVISFISVVSKKELPDEFQLMPSEFSIPKALGAFPTLLLAFNWQFNMFPVYKGLLNTSDKRFMIVSYTGMSIATVSYLIVGTFGYGIYGNNITSNFLEKATMDRLGRATYLILNGSFYLSTVLTTPLVFYGARNNFISLIKIFGPKNKVEGEEIRLTRADRKKREAFHFYFWSIFWFTLITIGAVTIHSLEVAFNVVGSISSNSIGCILPSLFYFMLIRQTYLMKGFSLTNWENVQYKFSMVFFVYSILISILCLSSELYNQIKK